MNRRSSKTIVQKLLQILYRSSSSIITAKTSSPNMTHLVPHPVEIDAHRLSKSSGISAVDLVNTLVGVGGSLSGNVMTDKASMLNEAIEYLKHLQLQVQTLSGLAAISAFVAPEVLSENYSEKVNIWSAGVLLHALLVAALPFKGDSLEAVCDAIKNVKLDFHSGI